MQDIIDFVTTNKWPIGGVLVALLATWDKVKAVLLSLKDKVKIPKFGPKPSVTSDELADQEALRHLRNRAVSFGSKELMTLIKEIDTRFYDIHAGAKNEK